MSLARALKYLLPDIVIGEAGTSECAIERLSDGRHVITHWTRAEKQPTEQEIAAAEIAAAAVDARAATDKATLDGMRDQVKSALANLDTIQRAASFTNAQRDAAIKEIAQILERLIRVVMEQAR